MGNSERAYGVLAPLVDFLMAPDFWLLSDTECWIEWAIGLIQDGFFYGFKIISQLSGRAWSVPRISRLQPSHPMRKMAALEGGLYLISLQKKLLNLLIKESPPSKDQKFLRCHLVESS